MYVGDISAFKYVTLATLTYCSNFLVIPFSFHLMQLFRHAPIEW